jgi:hypothetical protein
MGKFDAVYVCEDVSSIEFKDGLFYLTDDFGEFQIRRAMRPSTFFRCVRGAMQLVKEFDGTKDNVLELRH